MSTRWTEEQYRTFMQRRLKQEEPARVSIQSKVAASRMSYNPQVVTAFFREHGIAEPLYELQFAAPRRWRMDLAWIVPTRLCLEVQGGIFSGGAHVRGAHLLREFEKFNEAAAMGFRVLFVTPDQLCTAATADLVRRCLGL